MTHLHHTIDYVELAGGAEPGRLAATRDFYASAFGWTFTEYGPDYLGIRWSEGDGEVGGIDGTVAASPSGVLVLLYSVDLDASVAAVEAAGGAIVVAPYDFPGGRRFTFTDPAGNRLGVWAEG